MKEKLYRISALAIALIVLVAGAAVLAEASGGRSPAGGALGGERLRVIVSTDIGGGDEDDDQSMVHFLLYADLFDIEGLVSSPPGRGRAKDILEVIDAYEKDWPRLRACSKRYPTPARLRSITRQGAVAPRGKGGRGATEGSRWIVRQAKRRDDPRPLWILVWGSITDVAQALEDDPSIEPRLRVHAIASWNRRKDPDSYRYLETHHPGLWIIVSEVTFRGWYTGGNQEGDLSNREFVRRHARGHGALGDYFAPLKGGRIKMGDTPSVAYLLRGDPLDPTTPSWGGRFRLWPGGGRPSWWVDLAGKEGLPGDPRRTVSRWREAYLRDFQARLDRCRRGREKPRGR